MSLITNLILSITAINRKLRPAPQPQGEGFDVLLTQSDDAIIAQDGRFIVRQTVLYELETQDGLLLLTQDGKQLVVGF
jgi:hypothetical protein